MILTIANQKGGVGKTTTAHSLISILAAKGYKVLGIDLDPQGNLSFSFKADVYNVPTIYEVMSKKVSVNEVIQHVEDFDIIPANIMLAGIEQEISYRTGKEYCLKENIDSIFQNYDFIIIDTPPSLGILTINAFTASDKILIPTTPGIFATFGINQLNETIKSVKKYCNSNLEILGILFTKFNPRINVNKQLKELVIQLSEHISESSIIHIFDVYIRNSVVVEELQANQKSIFNYNKKSVVIEDYKNFIDEFLSII